MLCAHTLACNRKQPFLNLRKEENDRRNYFVINLPESVGPGSNSRLLDLQPDMHLQSDMLPTALRIPIFILFVFIGFTITLPR